MFHRVLKHSKTIKELGLRPRAFVCFLVFGNPDETLALVFEVLLKVSIQNLKTYFLWIGPELKLMYLKRKTIRQKIDRQAICKHLPSVTQSLFQGFVRPIRYEFSTLLKVALFVV